MKVEIYQVDAFTTEVFKGNPAAVCPLKHWLPDETLQSIAEENNLSETAFFVLTDNDCSLRWFTPEAEVELCGHATLAAAHVIFTHCSYDKESVSFTTRSGPLTVRKMGMEYCMDFPATIPECVQVPDGLFDGLNIEPIKVLAGFDYIVIYESEGQIQSLQPDFAQLLNLDKRGVVVTAQGDNVDFVSRCFFPKLRVNEDPVTGSAHCQLTPYWSEVLEKQALTAKQLSKRTGFIQCTLNDDRVELRGSAIDYMKGVIQI